MTENIDANKEIAFIKDLELDFKDFYKYYCFDCTSYFTEWHKVMHENDSLYSQVCPYCYSENWISKSRYDFYHNGGYEKFEAYKQELEIKQNDEMERLFKPVKGLTIPQMICILILLSLITIFGVAWLVRA